MHLTLAPKFGSVTPISVPAYKSLSTTHFHIQGKKDLATFRPLLEKYPAVYHQPGGDTLENIITLTYPHTPAAGISSDGYLLINTSQPDLEDCGLLVKLVRKAKDLAPEEQTWLLNHVIDNVQRNVSATLQKPTKLLKAVAKILREIGSA